MAEIGYIQVVRKCNQHCRFCSNPENECDLPLECARALVDEVKSQGMTQVVLSGGEPTLYPPLPELLRHCRDVGVHPRIITNGQRLAEESFVDALAAAGLEHVHVSLHSCRGDVHDFLTQTPGSLARITQALAHCGQRGMTVNINTVINRYNADHLDETARWVLERFPFVRHYVWNNLDPHMNRVQSHPDVIPRFQDFEVSLFRAASLLRRTGRTFRIERVPLCYMAEFAECSTETRKIVKAESRDIYFLDARGHLSQSRFYYEKADVCAHCSVNPICAGVYCGGTHYAMDSLAPLFIDRAAVEQRVLHEAPARGPAPGMEASA